MAGTSLSLQDVSIAAEAYEAAGELSRATILQLMTKIDDSNLLAGQVLSFLGDLDRARELSLLSSNSIQALDLSIQLEEEGDEVEFACQVHNEEQLILVCMEYESEKRYQIAAMLQMQPGPTTLFFNRCAGF